MKLRIEGCPANMLAFIEANNYPLKYTLDELAPGKMLIFRVETSDDLVIGYIWGFNMDEETFLIYVCISPRWRKRWLTKGLLQKLLFVAELFNVRIIGGQISDPIAARLAERLGFTNFKDVYLRDLTDGWKKEFRSEHEHRSSDCPASGSG